MRSLFNLLFLGLVFEFFILDLISHLRIIALILLITVYLIKFNSLINIILILEIMILNILIFIFIENINTHLTYWNIFSILVFRAVEARIGLALLVLLARTWGSSIKINLFK